MVFSLIVQFFCTLILRAMVEAEKPVNNRNRDQYPKIVFTQVAAATALYPAFEAPLHAERTRASRIMPV
jgi:hypothetical protein